MKRLFVAIPIPDEIANTTRRLQDLIKDPTIRWVKRDNLHITVFFLGYIQEEDTGKIVAAIKNALIDIESFRLEFASITLAPLNKPPSMIWAQYASNSLFQKAVTSVEQSVRTFTKKTRNFKYPIPHITLARFRKKDKMDISQIALSSLHVTSLVLYESHLTPESPQYIPLNTYLLKE